jgi:hypothetical protein
MNLITTLESRISENYKKNYRMNLLAEALLVEKHFEWLKIEINGTVISGRGTLKIGDKSYVIELFYSPFYSNRSERIYIRDTSIKYNKHIHLYNDFSLCLYHPVIDKPILKIIPLYKMIPWITEWCIHYENWKKYGVWLGKEIKH